ncbi:MAG: TetR/AcrR family transcriptional regulator [Ilumatobacteraceae bacterium]
MPIPPARAGRPRDCEIDTAILETTRRHLAAHGVSGLSIAAIADEAGSTRQALYRRWPDKLSLAVAAVADLAETTPPVVTGEPLRDLIAELTHFRECIVDASSLALAGVMLQEDVDPEFRRVYRERLVKPRRSRVVACLERGIALGLLPGDADVAIASTFVTGSWYAMAVAGTKPPKDWADRTAHLVWRACGGKG